MDCKAFSQRWALLDGGATPSKRCLSRLIIKVWLMVRIEADMIVNRINHYRIDHHHIIHHQDIIYNIFNLMNFSIKRNYEISSITTIMIMNMEGCSIIGNGGLLILTLIGEADFWTLIGEVAFLILFMTKEENTQILMSFFILFLLFIGVRGAGSVSRENKQSYLFTSVMHVDLLPPVSLTLLRSQGICMLIPKSRSY